MEHTQPNGSTGPTSTATDRPVKKMVVFMGELNSRQADGASRVCGSCGAQYEPIRVNQKYCGNPCSWDKGWQRECEGCGEQYQTRHSDQRYCSKPCAFKHGDLGAKAHPAKADSVMYKRWSRKAARSMKKQRKLALRREFLATKIRTCPECEQAYEAEYYGQVYCSKTCQRRKKTRTKTPLLRARKHGVVSEAIDPIKVFVRDDWKCQQCNCETPRELRGGIEDNAPEMDHIVPLSKGGSHTYENVQCLCRKCNGIKSDTHFTDLDMTRAFRSQASRISQSHIGQGEGGCTAWAA